MAHGGLLAIFAHPDDETFGVGGTMAIAIERGLPVTMVCATRGEVGQISPGTDATPETLGAHREQELRDAMHMLGVDDVRFLDFRDSGMRGTPENEHPGNLMNATPERVIGPLVDIIRERRPDVIVTWDASGGYGHPDHIAIHEHATAAYRAAADGGRADNGWRTPALFYVSIPVEEFVKISEEMRRRGLEAPFGEDFGDEIASLPRLTPNCVVDVRRLYALKEAAMLSHRTQLNDIQAFMRMPEDIRRDFFGREYFYRVEPPLSDGVMLDFLRAD
jgi:LmbE family N-acetylglucosaminyl deacetylase